MKAYDGTRFPLENVFAITFSPRDLFNNTTSHWKKYKKYSEGQTRNWPWFQSVTWNDFPELASKFAQAVYLGLNSPREALIGSGPQTSALSQSQRKPQEWERALMLDCVYRNEAGALCPLYKLSGTNKSNSGGLKKGGWSLQDRLVRGLPLRCPSLKTSDQVTDMTVSWASLARNCHIQLPLSVHDMVVVGEKLLAY